MPPASPSTHSVLFLHPSLKLTDLHGRGLGFTATKLIKRGELLLEEKPFIWDSGSDPTKPDLGAGVDWLLETGAVDELPCPINSPLTKRARAEAVASVCAYRIQAPCADGHYPALLFRMSSRFNHSCFPNAGAYTTGGVSYESVAAYFPAPLATYAIEDIHHGAEVCISYLSDAHMLSSAQVRQAALKHWGFLCDCIRCKGGRPLDKRLEGALLECFDSELDKRRAIARANKEYQALFDPDSEEFNPPAPDDFAATVERLNGFRERNKFLDKAHIAMQRVRQELIAAFLVDGPDSSIGIKFAGMTASLLVEEMHVQNALLPGLCPCKAPMYAKFKAVLRNVPEKERIWLEREVKEDGCELMHSSTMWVHDPEEAKRLGIPAARNLPSRPKPGPPPRLGPTPSPGACCSPSLGMPAGRPLPQATTCCSSRNPWLRRQHHGRPGRRRRAPRQKLECHDPALIDEDDWMPPLIGKGEAEESQPPDSDNKAEDSKLVNLWEAYSEFGRPSAAARSLGRTKGNEQRKTRDEGKSWFKFKA